MRLAILLLAAAGVLVVPFEYLGAACLGLLAAAAATLNRRAVLGLMAFGALSMSLSGLFFGLMGPAQGTAVLGPATFSVSDAFFGAWTGARLFGVFTVFAIGAHLVPARDLLPYVSRRPLPAYLAGAVLRLVPTLRADAERLKETQIARGHAFGRGLRAARAWLPLLVPLFVAAVRRAREQAVALHLAGLAPDPPGAPRGRRAFRWATVATLAALAVAGRLPLAGVPNVSLSYLVVFLSGVAFGPGVGLGVGLLYRVASDLWLSGPNPLILPWVIAEGAMGLGAGLAGRAINFGQRGPLPPLYAAVLAGTAGWIVTLSFSLTSDTLDWAWVQYFGAGIGQAPYNLDLSIYAARGLLFNVHSMVINAVLFGATCYPVLRALHASGSLPLEGGRPSPPSGAAPR